MREEKAQMPRGGLKKEEKVHDEQRSLGFLDHLTINYSKYIVIIYIQIHHFIFPIRLQ
jgi:hypothetical protein